MCLGNGSEQRENQRGAEGNVVQINPNSINVDGLSNTPVWIEGPSGWK